jgi:hypothetical protein
MESPWLPCFDAGWDVVCTWSLLMAAVCSWPSSLQVSRDMVCLGVWTGQQSGLQWFSSLVRNTCKWWVKKGYFDAPQGKKIMFLWYNRWWGNVTTQRTLWKGVNIWPKPCFHRWPMLVNLSHFQQKNRFVNSKTNICLKKLSEGLKKQRIYGI